MSYLVKSSCLILVLAISASASAGLVCHWDFNDSNQVGKAIIGDDLGAVGNAAYTAAGIDGGGLLLDGDGDFLQFGDGTGTPANIPTGDSSFTVAAFIKTNDVSSVKKGIVGWGSPNGGQFNGTHVKNSPTNCVQNFSWGGTAYDCTSSVVDFADGNWHHIAATYDATSSTKKLFFDGFQVGSITANDLNVTATNFRLGNIFFMHNSAPTNEYFNGTLDDVRIYDTALNQIQIDEITSVPEPSVCLLLLTLISFGMLMRRR